MGSVECVMATAVAEAEAFDPASITFHQPGMWSWHDLWHALFGDPLALEYVGVWKSRGGPIVSTSEGDTTRWLLIT